MAVSKNFAICGFPGVGKSWAAETYGIGKYRRNVIDLDSSKFRWEKDENGEGIPNLDWPENYVDEIERLLNEPKNIVLISTHPEVRDEMRRRGVPYVIVAPKTYDDKSDRDEYLRTFLRTGRPYEFIKKVGGNFYAYKVNLVRDMTDNHTPLIWLEKDQTLSDVLPLFVSNDNPLRDWQL